MLSDSYAPIGFQGRTTVPSFHAMQCPGAMCIQFHIAIVYALGGMIARVNIEVILTMQVARPMLIACGFGGNHKLCLMCIPPVVQVVP